MSETEFRTEHRYRALLAALGVDPDTLDGKSPEESEAIFEAAVRRAADELTAKRTEDAKLAEDPITIRLGDRDYDIRPAKIKGDREWRKLAVKIVEKLQGKMRPMIAASSAEDMAPETKAELMAQFLGGLAMLSIDEIYEDGIALLFAYSPALADHREEIENTATAIQIVRAFKAVMDAFIFPFVQAATMATTEALGKLASR